MTVVVIAVKFRLKKKEAENRRIRCCINSKLRKDKKSKDEEAILWIFLQPFQNFDGSGGVQGI